MSYTSLNERNRFDKEVLMDSAKRMVIKHWITIIFVVIVVIIVLCQLGSISSKLSDINRGITTLSSKIYIGADNGK